MIVPVRFVLFRSQFDVALCSSDVGLEVTTVEQLDDTLRRLMVRFGHPTNINTRVFSTDEREALSVFPWRTQRRRNTN